MPSSANQSIAIHPAGTASQAAAPQDRFLKICFILEPLHAGVGRHVVDAACGLAQRGHEIHVLYSPVRLEPSFLADLSQQPRIRCHAIRMMPGLSAGDIMAFWKVKNYVKANGPFDIVHGESSKGGGFARLLKLFGASTVFYSPHAFITLSPLLSFPKKLAFRTIEFLLSHLTDKTVCSSQYEHDHALGLGIAQKKLTVLVNGRAPAKCRNRTDIRADLGYAAETVVIGFVGRLETQKAPHRLIEACLRVLPKIPQLHLLMIGDGPERSELEKRVQDAKMDHRVTWLGAVDGVQYMPAMDILAISSIYEGFAYVLLEALNAGLPIVTTPVGGVRESVLQGRNGIIVPHESIESMASALSRLAREADRRHAMGRISHERSALFSLSRMIDTLEAQYYQSIKTGLPEPQNAAQFPKPAASVRSI